jgi:hypothetical protein
MRLAAVLLALMTLNLEFGADNAGRVVVNVPTVSSPLSDGANTDSPLKETDVVAVPRLLNCQGSLLDAHGNPVPDADYSVQFSLYPVGSGGTACWNETRTVGTREGLFSVQLGSVPPIDSSPQAVDWYLALKVGTDPEMTPRLRIAGATYTTAAALGSDNTGGHDLTDANRFGLGDSDWVRVGSDSVLYTIRQLGIAKGGSDNALYGTYRQTHVNLGVACTTGTNGQNYAYGTVGGGYGNKAGGIYATAGGGRSNTASGTYTTASGGYGNKVTGSYATAGGGYINTASGT